MKLDFLSQAGESRHLSVDSLEVSLKWQAPVDLDLCVFYRTKAGESGAILSQLYEGGNQGSLKLSPFIELSDDEGVDERGGEKEEKLQIAHFRELEEVALVALNFSEAQRGEQVPFASYDGIVEVRDATGAGYALQLSSPDAGSVALFGLIQHTNSLMGPQLSNVSEVMSVEALKTRFPGAEKLALRPKVTLARQGQRAKIRSSSDTIRAVLRWKTAVDLDLHCLYQRRAVQQGGFLSRLFGGGGSGEVTQGHISFQRRGALHAEPFIYLDQDAGVGDQGGENEETMTITSLGGLDRALIVANIYRKPDARFGSYDGVVLLELGEQRLEVPLTEKRAGAWCLIAEIERVGERHYFVNRNRVTDTSPRL